MLVCLEEALNPIYSWTQKTLEFFCCPLDPIFYGFCCPLDPIFYGEGCKNPQILDPAKSRVSGKTPILATINPDWAGPSPISASQMQNRRNQEHNFMAI